MAKKEEEKRIPATVQVRPSVMRQAKLACFTAGRKFPEWLESAIVLYIPPVFQKGIGKVK